MLLQGCGPVVEELKNEVIGHEFLYLVIDMHRLTTERDCVVHRVAPEPLCDLATAICLARGSDRHDPRYPQRLNEGSRCKDIVADSFERISFDEDLRATRHAAGEVVGASVRFWNSPTRRSLSCDDDHAKRP